MPVENTTLYLRSVRRGKLPCSYGWSYTWSYLNGLHKLASGHVTWKKEKETFTGTIVNRYFPHRHANENAFKSSFLSSNQHPVQCIPSSVDTMKAPYFPRITSVIPSACRKHLVFQEDEVNTFPLQATIILG